MSRQIVLRNGEGEKKERIVGKKAWGLLEADIY